MSQNAEQLHSTRQRRHACPSLSIMGAQNITGAGMEYTPAPLHTYSSIAYNAHNRTLQCWMSIERNQLFKGIIRSYSIYVLELLRRVVGSMHEAYPTWLLLLAMFTATPAHSTC